jgi:hypothetical protein
MDIVTVVNEHDSKTYNIDYYATRYTLAPGESVRMPFDAICSVLGHPGLYDNPQPGQQNNQARSDTLQQLLRFWGIHPGFDDDASTDAKLPKLGVFDQDGVRIHMLLQDPDGRLGQQSTIFGQAPAATGDRMALLEQQVAALLHANAKLTAQVEAVAPGALPAVVLPEVTVPPAPDLTPTFDAATHGTAGSAQGVQEIPPPPANTEATVDTPGAPRAPRRPRR